MSAKFMPSTFQHLAAALKRRSLIVLPALAALLLLAAGCGDSTVTTADLATDSGGKLEITETEYNFGDVAVGEAATHSFEIKNTGQGTLRLGELGVKMMEGC